MPCRLAFSLTHTLAGLKEHAPHRKLSFTSLAKERLLILFPSSSSSFLFPLGPTDRLTGSASSRSPDVDSSSSSSLCFVFYRSAVAPLLLSTALLTSKWGDPVPSSSSKLSLPVETRMHTHRPTGSRLGSFPTRNSAQTQFLLEPIDSVEQMSKRNTTFLFFLLPSAAASRASTHTLSVTVSLR